MSVLQDLINDVTLTEEGIVWSESASRNKGKPVGCEHRGYFVFNYKRKQYKLHRLLAVLYGLMTHEQFYDSSVFIDHIDGNGLNNTKDNLRICSNKENQRNQKLHRDGRKVGVSKNGTYYLVRRDGEYIGAATSYEAACEL